MHNNQPNESQKLILAEKATRFGHNIIDTIGFYFIVFLHAMVLDEWLGIIPEGGSDWFVFYFFFLYVMYHAFFEHFFGKTPGKFITKTKVVKNDGSKPSFMNILGRNTARLIPFDPLSFLFSDRGWHDQISNTYVIVDKKKE
ncbi:RDD family protein [Flavobacteriaceae bacterium 144Ye]|nr:RDD family protein [Flavobacteriaceae bacterium 144Ye]